MLQGRGDSRQPSAPEANRGQERPRLLGRGWGPSPILGGGQRPGPAKASAPGEPRLDGRAISCPRQRAGRLVLG